MFCTPEASEEGKNRRKHLKWLKMRGKGGAPKCWQAAC